MKKKSVKIRIIKNVLWEDWGTPRIVFRRGWEGWVTGYFENGSLRSVSGESPIYKGVSDEIWDDCYEVIEVIE